MCGLAPRCRGQRLVERLGSSVRDDDGRAPRCHKRFPQGNSSGLASSVRMMVVELRAATRVPQGISYQLPTFWNSASGLQLRRSMISLTPSALCAVIRLTFPSYTAVSFILSHGEGRTQPLLSVYRLQDSRLHVRGIRAIGNSRCRWKQTTCDAGIYIRWHNHFARAEPMGIGKATLRSRNKYYVCRHR